MDAIIREVRLWMLTSTEFHAISLNDFIRDWTIAIMPSISTQHSIGLAWISPLRGKLKLNFDGLAKGNLGPAGFGGIIRDENGQVVLTICGLLGEGDSTTAELLNLLYGLREIKKLGQHDSLAKGDSKVVISWVM